MSKDGKHPTELLAASSWLMQLEASKQREAVFVV